MSRHMMRTTVRLNEALLDEAKATARQRHTTLTALIEDGLRLTIATNHAPQKRRRVVLPVASQSGGTLPGVDINNNAALLEFMERHE